MSNRLNLRNALRRKRLRHEMKNRSVPTFLHAFIDPAVIQILQSPNILAEDLELVESPG